MAEPIFIGGCGRSGTTLFVDLLGCHPDIAPIYEPWFVCNVAELIFIRRDLPAAQRLEMIRAGVEDWVRDLHALPHDKRDNERYRHGIFNIRFDRHVVRSETDRLCRRLAADPPLAAFRDYLLALFEDHAKAEGKPRWVAKVPRFVQMLPLLVRLFPDLKFFHCVRHPCATIASMASREWAPASLDARIDYWRDNVVSGVRFAAQHPGQCFEVRYEDLLADTEAVLSRSCGWLGIVDCAADIVEEYKRDFTIDPLRSNGRDGTNVDDAPLPSTLQPLMDHFGYR